MDIQLECRRADRGDGTLPPLMTTGCLLINLGTPAAPTTAAVRSYLREFLSDPRVIDIPAPARFLLVNGVIAPFRSSRSAAAYAQVWTDDGSPLLTFGQALAEAVRTKLKIPVELGMRYGQPSIPSALERLLAAGCERLKVLPLYPQYASSSTGSSLEVVYREIAGRWNTPYVDVVPPFYDAPAFVRAFADVGRPVLADLKPERVLFSYHGLPERQIRKSDTGGSHCLQADSCCDAITTANSSCYRAQCYATTRALVQELGLEQGTYTTSFQSRLGRSPWIQPFTDVLLGEWAREGVKSVAVFCPSFVADCLETLEEIALREAGGFRAAGGEELRLVPSLNAEPGWVDGVCELMGMGGSSS